MLLALVSLVGACGAEPLRIALEPGGGPDPFAGVELVVVSVAAPDLPEPLTRKTSYRAGARLRLPDVPHGAERVVTVEGLDAEGLAVARGVSAPFTLSGERPGRVTLPFGRCGLLRYPDLDRDTHGDQARRKTLCEPLEGFVVAAGDCDDADPDANPDQQQYFARPRRGAGGHDYDCDGVEQRQGDRAVDCDLQAAATCKETAGWVGEVPACGAEGSWVHCAKVGRTCAAESTQVRVQSCR